jgi:hypothetical protein
MLIYLENPAYGVTLFVVGYYQIEFIEDVIQHRITQKQENSNLR